MKKKQEDKQDEEGEWTGDERVGLRKKSRVKYCMSCTLRVFYGSRR